MQLINTEVYYLIVNQHSFNVANISRFEKVFPLVPTRNERDPACSVLAIFERVIIHRNLHTIHSFLITENLS